MTTRWVQPALGSTGSQRPMCKGRLEIALSVMPVSRSLLLLQGRVPLQPHVVHPLELFGTRDQVALPQPSWMKAGRSSNRTLYGQSARPSKKSIKCAVAALAQFPQGKWKIGPARHAEQQGCNQHALRASWTQPAAALISITWTSILGTVSTGLEDPGA